MDYISPMLKVVDDFKKSSFGMNMNRKVPGNEGALASNTNILLAWANRALNSSSDVRFVRWYTACTGTRLDFNIFTRETCGFDKGNIRRSFL